MSNNVRSAVYTASQDLAAQGLTVKRSHVSEIVSALLGYRTNAALAVDEADATREYHLDDAEIYVLNIPLGTARLAELGLHGSAAASAVVPACIHALKAGSTGAGVFESVADFYSSQARDALANAIYDSEDVASAMAESNATFPDEPAMEDEWRTISDPWTARDEWTIEADGAMTGEYDPEGDRMFNGDTLNCRGWLTYRKAGRAGLVLAEVGGCGGADDSWRDRDYQDEMAFGQSTEGGQARS